MIKPAVEGTIRVLKAASNGRVKRVVLTSSFAAIGYTHTDENSLIDENSWTDTNKKGITPYIKSKTFAEKAAWDYIKKDDSGLELSVICPRLILGPTLGSSFSSSVLAVKKLFDGSMKLAPNVSYGIIDVRDVADLHILAMINSNASGERFLASSGDPMTFHDMALLIKKEFGEKAKQVSTKVYPNWIVRAVSLFNPEAKNIVHQLGKTFKTENSKPVKMLGWRPRSREEAIVATIKSIMEIECEE